MNKFESSSPRINGIQNDLDRGDWISYLSGEELYRKNQSRNWLVYLLGATESGYPKPQQISHLSNQK